MKRGLQILMCFASLWSLSAFAVNAQTGVFAGLNGGWSLASSKPNLPGNDTKDRNYTWGGSLGYDYAVDNNVVTGIEANYSNFGKTEYSNSASAGGNFENSALQLLLTGTYLMDNGFNTFVKAGAAHEQTELSFGNSAAGVAQWLPAVAAGLGYEFIQNLNIYGQYERTFGNNWENATLSDPENKPVSLNVFSVGVNYTFPM